MTSSQLILSSQYQGPSEYPDPMLGVENLTVRYGAHTALEGATVRFAPGTFSAVIGPNGAGKSTLLKTLVGLTTPSSGEVTFSGAAVPGTTWPTCPSSRRWTGVFRSPCGTWR